MDNEPYEKENEGWQDSKPKPGWMQLMAEQEERKAAPFDLEGGW